MIDASVIIPFMDRDDRRPLFDYILQWARLRFRQVIVQEAPADAAQFCKSRLMNLAAQEATKNVLGFLDADCWVSDTHLLRCFRLAASSRRLIYPYTTLIRLNQEQTLLQLQIDPANPAAENSPIWNRRELKILGRAPGGMMFCNRTSFDAIGGWDEKYIEWGAEDSDFKRRMKEKFGRELRCVGHLYHLWHKPNENRPQANRDRYFNRLSRFDPPNEPTVLTDSQSGC